MSPTSSKAALRVLVSVLLASSIANAAALPHQLIDARAPLAQLEDAPSADEALQAITAISSDIPENTFQHISDDLNKKSAFQVLMEFITQLVGPRVDDADSTATATVYITPTPIPAESISSAVEVTPTPTPSDMVVPPGPPTTSTDVTSSVASTTPGPAASDTMSILPVGDLSSAINATTLTPVFSTAPETTSVASSILPPYPANSSSTYILPTAVSITGWFPVNPTLVLTNPIQPTSVSNATAPLNTTLITLSLTSVTVVTQTIVPTPIGTGIGAPISAGTGAPIAVSETPLWSNSSDAYAAPTILPGTGTGAPISVGTGSPIAVSESPIYANTTPSVVSPPVFVTQVPLTVTGVAGSVLNVSVSIPNAPFANSTVSATGYAAPASETPYFNTTTTLGETATAAPVSVSAGTIAPVASYSAPPLFLNTTTAVVIDVTVSTAVATLILPTATDVAVEFPGTLNVTGVLPTGGYYGKKH